MDDANDNGDGTGMCFPYDVLLSILRRLPCRDLAQARGICRSWRRTVDAHKLLLNYFFPPRSFPGVFTNHFGCRDESYFLAPPSRSRRTNGRKFRRPLFWHGWAKVKDHCNDDDSQVHSRRHDEYVCNPATSRCAPLPRLWPYRGIKGTFLAFDPAVSPHYEVYKVHPTTHASSSPSSPLAGSAEPKAKVVDSLVFSSRTGKWDTREFTPGRCAKRWLRLTA